MQRFNYYILPVLLMFSLSAGAQAEDEKDKIIKLYEETRQQQGRISELTDSLGLYKQKIVDLESEITDLKEKNDNSLIERQDLLKQIEEEKAASANSGLEIEVENLQQQLFEKDSEIEKFRRTNELLKNDLANLNRFKKEFLAMMAKNVDTEWMQKKLSEINLTDLNYAIDSYSEFVAEDPRLADCVTKLQTLKKNAEVYQSAVSLLNSQYNSQKVKTTQLELNKLLNTITNPSQEEELNMVSVKLFDYPGSVKAFKDLIQVIDEIVVGEDNHQAAIAMVKVTIEEEDNLQKKIKQINSIPWLKEQYDKYFRDLKKNSKAPNTVRTIIMSL